MQDGSGRRTLEAFDLRPCVAPGDSGEAGGPSVAPGQRRARWLLGATGCKRRGTRHWRGVLASNRALTFLSVPPASLDPSFQTCEVGRPLFHAVEGPERVHMRHLTCCAQLESITKQLVTQTELGEKGRAQDSGALRGGGQGLEGFTWLYPSCATVLWHPLTGLCLGVLAALGHLSPRSREEAFGRHLE